MDAPVSPLFFSEVSLYKVGGPCLGGDLIRVEECGSAMKGAFGKSAGPRGILSGPLPVFGSSGSHPSHRAVSTPETQTSYSHATAPKRNRSPVSQHDLGSQSAFQAPAGELSKKMCSLRRNVLPQTSHKKNVATQKSGKLSDLKALPSPLHVVDNSGTRSPQLLAEREEIAKKRRLAWFGAELSQPVVELVETPVSNAESSKQQAGIDISEATAIVGLCPDICPVSERGERERKGDLDKHEWLDGDRNQTAKFLAVKEYTRTAKRDPDLIRAPDLQSHDSRLAPPGIDSSTISRAAASSVPEPVVTCDIPGRVFLRSSSPQKKLSRRQRKKQRANSFVWRNELPQTSHKKNVATQKSGKLSDLKALPSPLHVVDNSGTQSPQLLAEREEIAKKRSLAWFGAELSQPVVELVETPVSNSESSKQQAGVDFSEATAIVGLCPDMCPVSERGERERKVDLDKHERLDGDRNQTAKFLAVKKYTRTAERDPDLIRALDLQSRDSWLASPGIDASTISRAAASSVPESVVTCDILGRVFLRSSSPSKKLSRRRRKKRRANSSVAEVADSLGVAMERRAVPKPTEEREFTEIPPASPEPVQVVVEAHLAEGGDPLDCPQGTSEGFNLVVETGRQAKDPVADPYCSAIVPHESLLLEANILEEIPIDIAFVSGVTAEQVLYQLERLWAECARSRVHLPPVDIQGLMALDLTRFASRLPEFAGVVARCAELVRSISWSREEAEFRRLEEIHTGFSHVVSRVESDLSRTRERLRIVECQLTRHITHCAQLRAEGADQGTLAYAARLTTLHKRDMRETIRLVDQQSALFTQYSHAHRVAGGNFREAVKREESRSKEVDTCLRMIADLVKAFRSEDYFASWTYPVMISVPRYLRHRGKKQLTTSYKPD